MNPTLVLYNPLELPDYFGDVINNLGMPAKIVRPGMRLEEFLDHQELRKVAVVAVGPAATETLQLAVSQPQRVTHVVLANPRTVGQELPEVEADVITIEEDAEKDPAGFAARVREHVS